jgi:hypothetical protein
MELKACGIEYALFFSTIGNCHQCTLFFMRPTRSGTVLIERGLEQDQCGTGLQRASDESFST